MLKLKLLAALAVLCLPQTAWAQTPAPAPIQVIGRGVVSHE